MIARALTVVADHALRWPRMRWIPAPVRMALAPHLSEQARDQAAADFTWHGLLGQTTPTPASLTAGRGCRPTELDRRQAELLLTTTEAPRTVLSHKARVGRIAAALAERSAAGEALRRRVEQLAQHIERNVDGDMQPDVVARLIRRSVLLEPSHD